MSFLTVQTMLKAAGFDPGPIDGKWGVRTAQALTMALDAAGGAPAAPVDLNDALLAEELLRDEGFVPHAYKDSNGYWTIGIGRLIDERRGGGISREEALFLKRNDIARFKVELDKVAPWWRSLSPVRRRVLQNMIFQLGPQGLASFKNTLRLIEVGKYSDAAKNMLKSTWAQQTPNRAKRLAQMMEADVAI